MATENNINITSASLRGSPSDRIIKPRPRKDSLQSISGSESHPGRVQKPRARKSPGSGAKRSEPAKRKFICSFSHYGCDVALSSKNEWKRHVSIQHLQLGFYRCDVGSCTPETNPTVPGHKRVFNDFNRKDLFTQHHRRMHKPESSPPTVAQLEGGKDWRAFEDSLEGVRQRCWKEKRKAPFRSTCGFCGRVFEGDGSWNERMEHVGGHFSRDVIDLKEEREDEDLTNWSVLQGIVKEASPGRHVLTDQPPPPTERSYNSRDGDVQMSDVPPSTPNGEAITINSARSVTSGSRTYDDDGTVDTLLYSGRRDSTAGAYPPTNGSARSPTTPNRPSLSLAGLPSPGVQAAVAVPLTAPILAPAPTPSSRQTQTQDQRRGYNVAPPPLKGLERVNSLPSPRPVDTGSDDRLVDLINQLVQPKRPKESTHRRLTWKCDCTLEASVDIDNDDLRAIESLQDISIVCAQTTNAYLKVAKSGTYTVIACDELVAYIKDHSEREVEVHVRHLGAGAEPDDKV